MNRLRTTHTYAVLEVDAATYRDIRARLEAAGYQHAFDQAGGEELIDLHGIAIAAAPAPSAPGAAATPPPHEPEHRRGCGCARTSCIDARRRQQMAIAEARSVWP